MFPRGLPSVPGVVTRRSKGRAKRRRRFREFSAKKQYSHKHLSRPRRPGRSGIVITVYVHGFMVRVQGKMFTLIEALLILIWYNGPFRDGRVPFERNYGRAATVSRLRIWRSRSLMTTTTTTGSGRQRPYTGYLRKCLARSSKIKNQFLFSFQW